MRKKKVYNFKDFSKVRCYLILAEHKESGKLFGYCEESFSMGYYKEKSRVFRPYIFSRGFDRLTGKQINKEYAEYVNHLKEKVTKLNKKQDTLYRHFYVRVGSANCPVAVDWSDWYKTRRRSKFDWRNIRFTIKPEKENLIVGEQCHSKI